MIRLKRVISRNYPASRLPEDIRGDIDPTHRVTVTVEEQGPPDAEYETTVLDFAECEVLADGSLSPPMGKEVS